MGTPEPASDPAAVVDPDDDASFVDDADATGEYIEPDATQERS